MVLGLQLSLLTTRRFTKTHLIHGFPQTFVVFIAIILGLVLVFDPLLPSTSMFLSTMAVVPWHGWVVAHNSM